MAMQWKKGCPMRKTTLAAMTLAVTMLVGCSQALTPLVPAASIGAMSRAATALSTGIPHIRVFRGVKRADVAYGSFVADLSKRFIPAAPQTHAKNGLVAYLPALPPQPKPAGIADEFAIVVYESADVYAQAKATPEGQAYSDLHWELFDKAASKSTSAVNLESTENAIKADIAYDLMQKATDWQTGQATFSIGTRLKTVAAGEFLGRLTQHVQHVRTAFGPLGLDGYVVVATPDQEVAFMHWSSEQAAEQAHASTQGKAVAAERQALMAGLASASAKPFAGTIAAGQVVNVKFQKRH